MQLALEPSSEAAAAGRLEPSAQTMNWQSTPADQAAQCA